MIILKINGILKSYWLRYPSWGMRRILAFYLILLCLVLLAILKGQMIFLLFDLCSILFLSLFLYQKINKYGYYHKWYSKITNDVWVENVDLLSKARKIIKKNKYFHIVNYQKKFISNKGKNFYFCVTSKIDLKMYMKFYNKLIKEAGPGYYRREILTESEAKDIIKENKRADKICISVFYNKNLIGIGKLNQGREKENHSATLAEFNINKNFRRQGIGTELLKELISLSKKCWDLRLIKLHVIYDNFPAVNVYKKLGFKVCGRIPEACFYKRRYRDYLVMAKKINA